MGRQTFTERELDAASRLIQAENDLDDYVAAARHYIAQIKSEATRRELTAWLDTGESLASLPVYEVDAFDAKHGRRIAGVKRAIARNAEVAGGARA